MLYGGYQPKQKRPEDMPMVSEPTMPDYTIKKKLRFNDSLTFNESHILYNCVEKLEKIEQIVEQYQFYKYDGFLKIKEVLEQE